MRKYMKRIITVITAIILFIGIDQGLRYILVDDTSSYTRIMLHEMYESEENIDVAFVGSSHVFRSLIPDIADERLGAYTFNAGSSHQLMDGSFAMIKEITEYHDVQKIYLELYYGVVENGSYTERTSMTPTYILSDYMRPSFNKISYILKASSDDYWINSLILARRNWTSMLDYEYIQELISTKNSDSYRNYEWVREDGETEYYVDRGFVAEDATAEDDGYINEFAYGEIKAIDRKSDWYRSLQSIVDYCNSQRVELYFFIAPQPEWTIVGKQNYQEYHDEIQAISEELGVSFYDFNFCKNEYMDLNDRSLFRDDHHLNTTGAARFTSLFCDYYSGDISPDDLFYDTLQNKLDDEDPCVYGIAGPHMNDSGEFEYYIISNRDCGMKYRIIVQPDEGPSYSIQDYDDNTAFSLQANTSGNISVMWYYESAADMVHTMDIRY